MDKLPEPEYNNDSIWPRIKLGVKEDKEKQIKSYQKYFLIFAFASSFRYLREVTFYQKNYAASLVIVPLLVISSHYIALKHNVDPFTIAAEINNENENDFISKYKDKLREAKAHKIELPDEYIF